MKPNEIQKEVIGCLRNAPVGIVNLKTGLGKTYTFIQYLNSEIGGNQDLDVLILVPKSIVKQWEAALGEYMYPATDVKVIAQTQICKHPKLLDQADIICIDEPKLLKGNTKFAKLLLSRPGTSTQRRYLLDATILENSISELDQLAEWLRLEDRRSITEYIFPKNHPDNVAPRRVVWHKIKIPVPESRKPQIKLLEYQLAQTLIPEVGSVKMVFAAIYDLLSALNGFNKNEMGWLKVKCITDIIARNHAADCGIICATKLEAMQNIADAVSKMAGMKAAEVFHGKLNVQDRKGIVDKFNAGEIDWVVGTKAAERGLNMKRGNVTIHADIPWSGSSLVQRDRTTRLDSDLTKTTHIYVLICDDTAEEVVYEKAMAKKQMNDDLRDGAIRKSWGQGWKSFLCEKWKRLYKINLEKEFRRMSKFQSKVAVNSSVQVGKEASGANVASNNKILPKPVLTDGTKIRVGYGTTLCRQGSYCSVRVDCGVEYPTTKDKVKEAYAAAWDLVAEEFNTQLEDAKEFLKTL